MDTMDTMDTSAALTLDISTREQKEDNGDNGDGGALVSSGRDGVCAHRIFAGFDQAFAVCDF